MVKLILSEIEDLASSGAYGGLRSLSAETCATILSVAVWLHQDFNWLGAGYELTQTERDTIDAMVSELEQEVMVNIPGLIIISMSTEYTPGTLECNGTVKQRVDYPELYAVTPPDLIIDPDNFRLPALWGTFLRGASIPFPQGTTGGENSVELLEENLPAISVVSDGAANFGAGTLANLRLAVDGGTPHENQPNYMNVRFEITTGQ